MFPAIPLLLRSIIYGSNDTYYQSGEHISRLKTVFKEVNEMEKLVEKLNNESDVLMNKYNEIERKLDIEIEKNQQRAKCAAESVNYKLISSEFTPHTLSMTEKFKVGISRPAQDMKLDVPTFNGFYVPNPKPKLSFKLDCSSLVNSIIFDAKNSTHSCFINNAKINFNKGDKEIMTFHLELKGSRFAEEFVIDAPSEIDTIVFSNIANNGNPRETCIPHFELCVNNE